MNPVTPQFVSSGALFWTAATLAAFLELAAWCRRQ